MTKHILKNIEAREAELFLSAIHAITTLSPKAISVLYYVMEKEKQRSKKGDASGIFHRFKKRLTAIKFDLASYIYF